MSAVGQLKTISIYLKNYHYYLTKNNNNCLVTAILFLANFRLTCLKGSESKFKQHMTSKCCTCTYLSNLKKMFFAIAPMIFFFRVTIMKQLFLGLALILFNEITLEYLINFLHTYCANGICQTAE